MNRFNKLFSRGEKSLNFRTYRACSILLGSLLVTLNWSIKVKFAKGCKFHFFNLPSKEAKTVYDFGPLGQIKSALGPILCNNFSLCENLIRPKGRYFVTFCA